MSNRCNKGPAAFLDHQPNSQAAVGPKMAAGPLLQGLDKSSPDRMQLYYQANLAQTSSRDDAFHVLHHVSVRHA
jgi:hypothetical protein